MQDSESPQMFRVTFGALIPPTFVCIIKSIYASGFHEDPSLIDLLTLDLAFIATFSLATISVAYVRSRALRWFCLILLLLLSLFYIIDFYLLFTFNEHLTLVRLVKFSEEVGTVSNFVSIASLVFIGATIYVHFVSMTLAPRRLRHYLFACIFLFLLAQFSVAAIPKERSLTQHAFSFSQLLPGNLLQSQRSKLSYPPDEKIAAINELRQTSRFPELPQKPNVILLVVESLSAVDSKRTGGLYDRVPELDAMSIDGMQFTNYFSNFEDSEGAFVALLCALPPVPYPGSSIRLYDAYPCGEHSVVAQAVSSGYSTEFLTTGPLTFLSKGEFMKSIGFQKVRGLHEVERFTKAPRFVFNSPPDEYLYAEALETIDSYRPDQSPYFLTLFTLTGHMPWKDPQGIANTAEQVLGYVSRQIVEFYEELKARDFFKNGILIVTGDHRKMYPLHRDELKHYGESARARIFLSIVGSGIPAGILDERLLSQADLFPRFSDIIQPTKSLSPFSVLPSRYGFEGTDVSMFGSILVFNALSGLKQPLQVQPSGLTLSWKNPSHDPPEQQPQAWLDEIHRIRATGQFLRENTLAPCRIPLGASNYLPSDENGVRIALFSGGDLTPDLTPDSPRYIRSTRLRDLSLPELGAIRDTAPPFTISVETYLDIEKLDEYWFSLKNPDGGCLFVNNELVAASGNGVKYLSSHGSIRLQKGKVLLQALGRGLTSTRQMEILWGIKPQVRFGRVPVEKLFLPQ